jgi:hypothetical protein
MKQHLLVSVFLSIFLLGACSTNTKQPVAETMCKEPRPEICTMQYDPVCGVHSDNTTKTYASDCTACSHKEVVGYNADVCHYDESKTH